MYCLIFWSGLVRPGLPRMVRPVDDDSAGRRLRQTGLNEYLADFEELMLRPPQKRKTKINRAKNRNYVSMMAYPMRIADGDDDNDDETRDISNTINVVSARVAKEFYSPVTVNVGQSLRVCLPQK